MVHEIDLRRLAEMSAPERAFLTLYLRDADGLERLAPRLRTARALLADTPDERTHLDENLALAQLALRRDPPSGSVCVLACWALDLLEVLPLGDLPVDDQLWVDSSPFIRPLAELQDEHERFALIIVDNRAARIHIVSALETLASATVDGEIKNHVKVGGWSQQRYERRRDKQLKRYARDVIAALDRLTREHALRRLILVGGREAMAEIRRELPPRLSALLAAAQPLDLSKNPSVIDAQIHALVARAERDSERALWERIKDAYFQGGRAAVAVWDVLDAARSGQVEAMVVARDLRVEGLRCRPCGHLGIGYVSCCQACGSDDVFTVDLINEIVELLALSGATVDFVDPSPCLLDLDGIAALLRY